MRRFLRVSALNVQLIARYSLLGTQFSLDARKTAHINNKLYAQNFIKID